MTHIFDVEIAKEYGVNAAILLQNLGYWIMRNKANETNYYDGRYWTFNSRKAYRELFPYMSERQIDTAFKKLIDDGLVVTGNYNKLKYDRTLWYALTKKGECILHFDGMEEVKMSNEKGQNVKPIPDVNANVNPVVNNSKKVSKAKSFDEIINEYTQNEALKISLVEFVKMRSLNKRQPLTSHGLDLLLKKLDKLGQTDAQKIEIVDQSVMRGWAGFFAINEGNKPKQDKPAEEPKVYAHPFDDGSDPEYTRRCLEAQKRRGW